MKILFLLVLIAAIAISAYAGTGRRIPDPERA